MILTSDRSLVPHIAGIFFFQLSVVIDHFLLKISSEEDNHIHFTMRVLFVVLSALPLVFCTQAPAVDPATLAHLMFLDADTDKDGTLRRAEMTAVFTRYDADGDGRVTRHEYVEYQKGHDPELVNLAHFLFDTYDVDHDHRLEAHDYENFYRLMDNDGDDSVSEAEFTAYWTVLLQSGSHHIPGRK